MGVNRIIIQGADIYTPDQCLPEAAILVEGQVIQEVGTLAEAAAWTEAERIDARGLRLVPGFIELQINGAFGCDFTADPETIFPVAQRIPQYGVTSFLPTIVTSPLEKIARAQAQLQAGPPEGMIGARALGLHVEGPFLNPERKGAHRLEYLRSPDRADYASLSPESGVRLVTLAPELAGAAAVITDLIQRGIVVSAGHSLATFEQAQAAFRLGIGYATHLFNAMSPLMQFDPGLPGAILVEPGLRFGLIPDGIHVHPALVDLVWKLTGPGRLTIVSDAMAALGMRPGNYQLGDLDVVVDETSARLPNGVLAGSILSHPQALRNLLTFTNCTLEEALTCLTTTPASVLRLGDTLGQIAPGFRADLVLMTAQFEVVSTWVGGKAVFRG